MIAQPRCARPALHQRILARMLLVSLVSALSSTSAAQSTAAPADELAQPKAQPAASANTGVALGGGSSPAAYPSSVPPPPPNTHARPAPGTGYAPAPGTPYYAGAEPYRPRARISKGLLIGGAVTLGVSYVLSAAVGLATMGMSEYECIDCKDVGPWLLVPVLGPFIGAKEAVEGGGLIAMFGVAQVVGLGLLIGGIIRFKNTKRRAQESGYVFQLSRNKTLALDVATSPRFSGPELSLRF